MKNLVIGRVVATGLVAVALFAGCAAPAPAPTATSVAPADDPTPVLPAPVAANAVKIQGFTFGPAAIAVPVGATVIWSNLDVEQHTVTAKDNSFNSDALASGKAFSFTFAKAGSYRYFCQIHPNMVGEVVVSDQ